jgi:hypothetical protein
MIPVEVGFPAGTIVLATGGPPRFAEFWQSLTALAVPKGTQFAWNRTYDAASGREMMVRKRAPQSAWVWFLDDDHTFAGDALLRLLNNGIPVVGPVAARRRPPFNPIMMRESGVPYSWAELHGPGLLALDKNSTVGMGGLLVWDRVIRALEPPYFRVGQFDPAYMQEDVWFCRSLWAAGETITVDRDVIFGHVDTFAIIPKRTPEGWEIECVPGLGEVSPRTDAPFTEPPAIFHPLPQEVAQ